MHPAWSPDLARLAQLQRLQPVELAILLHRLLQGTTDHNEPVRSSKRLKCFGLTSHSLVTVSCGFLSFLRATGRRQVGDRRLCGNGSDLVRPARHVVCVVTQLLRMIQTVASAS